VGGLDTMMTTSSETGVGGITVLGKIALHFEKRWVCRRCTETLLGSQTLSSQGVQLAEPRVIRGADPGTLA
jgi:hypothetical protein